MEFYNVSGGSNYGAAYFAPNGMMAYARGAPVENLFNQQLDNFTSPGGSPPSVPLWIVFPAPVRLMRLRLYPLVPENTVDQLTGFNLYYGIGGEGGQAPTYQQGNFLINSSPSFTSVQQPTDFVDMDFGEGVVVPSLTFMFGVVGPDDRNMYFSEIEFYVNQTYSPPLSPLQTIINQTNITYQNLTYVNTTYLTQPTTITLPTYLNQTILNETYLSAPNITYQNITQTSPNVTYANYSYTNLTNETYVTATEGVQTFYYENTTERIINLAQPPTAAGGNDTPTTKDVSQAIQAAPSDPFPMWAGAIILLLLVIIVLQVMLMRKKPPPPPLAKTSPDPSPKPKAYPPLPFKPVQPKLDEPPPPPSAPSEAVESIKDHMDAIGVLEKTLKRADPRIKRLPVPIVEAEEE